MFFAMKYFSQCIYVLPLDLERGEGMYCNVDNTGAGVMEFFSLLLRNQMTENVDQYIK